LPDVPREAKLTHEGRIIGEHGGKLSIGESVFFIVSDAFRDGK
jgi:hypothetical protein